MAKAIFETTKKPLIRVYRDETLIIKRCYKCDEYKDIAGFNRDSSRCDGYMNCCRACEGYTGRRPGRPARQTPTERKRAQKEQERAYKARMKARTPEQIAADCARLRPDGLKKCSGPCKSRLPLSAFFNFSGSADGLNPYCRLCDLAKQLRVSRVALMQRWEDLDLWGCVYCGDQFEDVEHSIPKSRASEFGLTNANHIENLLPSCANCNRGPGGKHAQTPAEWQPEKHAELRAIVALINA